MPWYYQIPFAYVVRETVEVTPARDDAATNYDTIQDEMITRAPYQDEDGAHYLLIKQIID